MVRGYPDWVSSSDKREIVIKPTFLSLTGRLFCVDTFDSPTNSWTEQGHVGGQVDIITTLSHSGDGCLYIIPVVGANKTKYGVRALPIPETLKMGFECVFALDEDFDGTIVFTLNYYDQGTVYNPELRHNATTKLWYLKNSLGNFVEIPGSWINYITTIHAYHHLKFIVDFSTGRYVYAIIGKTLIDLSSYGIYVQTLGTASYLYSSVTNNSTAGGIPHGIRVDDFVITEE